MGRRAVLLATIALPLCLIAELLPIRPYATADGLAADHVNRIAVDSRGFVWFCTPEGLSRFDGYRMVNFGVAEGLPDRYVNALLETRSGEYLVGTARGLCQFRASGGGKFTTYLPGNNRRENDVTALIQDSAGRIWCGTEGGLFEMLSGPKFRRQGLTPLHGWDRVPVSDLVEDAGHKLWVATPEGFYVVAKDGSVEHIGKEDDLPNGWLEWVEALALDKQGRLWAGTRGGLLMMRDGNDGGRVGVQQAYQDIGGVKRIAIQALAEGPDGAVWAGTGVGIARPLPGSHPAAFRILTRAEGLVDRSITALATDRAGNVWAGTEGAGAMKIQPAGFTTYREQDGLASDRAFAVLADRTGTVLAVTVTTKLRGRSVNVFDGTGFRALVPKVFGDHESWGRHQILLQSRSGEWWAATNIGLCRFPAMKVADLARTQPETCYAPDTLVFRVFEDSKGRIWASAQSRNGNRLMRWNPRTDGIDFVEKGGGLVAAFAEDRSGAIWMGFWGDEGLLRYDGRQFTSFKAGDGAPAGAIFALLADSAGRLWIGSSDGGLGLVADPGSPQLHVKVYNTANGPPVERLASDTVYVILEDQAGKIYAGTAKGVDRLDPGTGRVKHFSTADGLARGQLRSAFRDGSGNLWFATSQGLSRLTPTAVQQPTIPTVLITELQTGGERYPVSQAGEALIRSPRLDPSRNELQVTFAGFNNEPGQSLSYKYKLEGTDKIWHDTREHTVNYAALAPAGYHFLVKAVNSEGGESATPAEIYFAIPPPVWNRWWFEALALACLAGLVLAAHRYRVAQAVQMERMRTRIATDLHDDIGASLSQIVILSEVLIQRSGDNQGLSGPLSGMARSAREVVASINDIVWAINPRHDHLSDLQQRMRRFASDLFAARNIDFVLRAEALDQDLKLGADMRREIFLVFKEAVNNIMRHSQCTQVEIDFCRERDWLWLRVSDNGKGLAACESGAGHGLLNMQARAKTLGGELCVTSTAGRGTAIALRVPLARPRAFPWRTPPK